MAIDLTRPHLIRPTVIMFHSINNPDPTTRETPSNESAAATYKADQEHWYGALLSCLDSNTTQVQAREGVSDTRACTKVQRKLQIFQLS